MGYTTVELDELNLMVLNCSLNSGGQVIARKYQRLEEHSYPNGYHREAT